MVTAVNNLVRSKEGLLNRRIFADNDIYQQELEQVFGRSWLFVGHESQVPNNNDFSAYYMGEDPVLVTRDSRGTLHTFLNMCRHRGNRICRADGGNAPSFMCTYHGWTFATDGKLVGVPGYKEAYFGELDRSQWGLVEAPTESYKGLVFANWDKTAPALLNYLGDATYFIDLLVDRRNGGAELLGGAHKLVLPVNWKFGADNFGGDNYHVPVSHGSTNMSGISPPRSNTPMNAGGTRFNVHAGNGHCIIGGYTGTEANPQAQQQGSPLSSYYAEHLPELQQRLGTQRARQITMGIATMFPNFTWFGGGGSGLMIRSWHPRGPGKTEAWTYCIVDKQAPQEVKDWVRQRLTLCFSPSGGFEQDDMDNFGQSTASGKYQMGRKYPVNVQMGLGHDTKHEALPGTLSPNISEGNARAFYGRWAEVMDAPSWSQISIAPKTIR
ncbi:MAG: aromatic ring-hydroxylating dioxygenase subunit alpha [Dehalococcoidia bacterium]|nr:aromatic ring-hydroxylating dioxygenase subunit alpha [Dehalococcoidia bacterium]